MGLIRRPKWPKNYVHPIKQILYDIGHLRVATCFQSQADKGHPHLKYVSLAFTYFRINPGN